MQSADTAAVPVKVSNFKGLIKDDYNRRVLRYWELSDTHAAIKIATCVTHELLYSSTLYLGLHA